MIEVEDVFTTTSGGARSQTLIRGGDIGLNVWYRTWDIPPSTPIQVFFIAEAIEQIYSKPYVFKPWHIIRADAEIGPGSWYTSVSWRLPDSDPFPRSPIPLADLERHFSEPWRFRNWGMLWTLKVVIGFLSPRVPSAVYGFSREPCVYRIVY